MVQSGLVVCGGYDSRDDSRGSRGGHAGAGGPWGCGQETRGGGVVFFDVFWEGEEVGVEVEQFQVFLGGWQNRTSEIVLDYAHLGA